MLTQFGKEVRKLRIDSQMRLGDMAEKLQVSSPYLSAVETGKKPVSKKLLDSTLELFGNDEDTRQRLMKAAEASVKVHTLQVREDAPTYESTVVARFARSIKGSELDEDSAKKIMDILEKANKTG